MSFGKDLTEMFKRVEWDAPTVGTIVWLWEHIKPGETLYTSLAALGKELRLGRLKLNQILSRCKKNKIICYDVKRKGGVLIWFVARNYVENNFISNIKVDFNLDSRQFPSSAANCADFDLDNSSLTRVFCSTIYFSNYSLPSSLASIDPPLPEASAKPCDNELRQSNELACSIELIPLNATSEVASNIRARTRAKKNRPKQQKKPSPRKKKSPPQESDFSPEELQLARDWLAYAQREMKWASPHASWNAPQFAFDLRRVAKAVDLNQDGLRAVLRFVEGHHFWARNALSPAGLLKRGAQKDLRKIDNILLQMKPNSLRQRERLQQLSPEEKEQAVDMWRLK